MLKVWFPGTNDTEDHGLGGTQWINDNVVVADNGKLGKCLSFNGSNSRLSTTNFELSNNWSFACWAKDDSSVTNWRLLIMLNTTGSDADTQMSFWLHTGEKRFEVCANGKYVSTVKYVPGQWNHFAATYNGSQILIYLNGVKVYTLADTNEQLARHNLTIGARGTNANGGHEGATSYFYGLVNDLRIWDDQVISPREIKELSKGLVLHYPLAMPGQENLAKNTNQIFESTPAASGSTYAPIINLNLTPEEITTDAVFTVSFNFEVIGNDKSANLYTQLNGSAIANSTHKVNATNTSGRYVALVRPSATQASDTSNPRIRMRINSTPTDGTVFKIWNVKFERGEVATPWIPATTDPEYTALGFNDGIEYDVSGYGYNATIVDDVSYSSDTPRYNTALSLDGNGHINCGHAFHIQGALNISVSLWAYLDDWADNVWEQFLSSEEAGGIVVAKSSANGIRGRFNVYTAEDLSAHTYKQADVSANTVSSIGVTGSGWHHIVTTYDANVGIKTYIDGVKRATSNFVSYGACFNSSASMMLGAECAGSNNYGVRATCKLSDVRFYYTTLTDDDVLELYHTPTSLSNNGTLLTQGEYEES